MALRKGHRAPPPRPRVSVVTRPMWRLRLTGALRRHLLRTLVLVALLLVAHLATDLKWQDRAPHTPTATEQRR
jgi:hypothetical protein